MTEAGRSYPPSVLMNRVPAVRSFADPTGEIDGRSVVQSPEVKAYDAPDRAMWPCSLPDFLRDFRGKPVMLEYLLPNSQPVRKRGVIEAAGTNFVGLRPQNGNELVIVDLSCVKCVTIYR